MPTPTSRHPRAIHLWLWVVQGLLALVYLLAGTMKTTLPIAALTARWGWPGTVPPALIRFIGAAELAGALGLILPAAARVLPRLTPTAAVGLVVLQLLAMLFHLSRGQASVLPINLTLAALAAFVAWGRFRKAPIEPRPLHGATHPSPLTR
jgi:hypothetical protein